VPGRGGAGEHHHQCQGADALPRPPAPVEASPTSKELFGCEQGGPGIREQLRVGTRQPGRQIVIRISGQVAQLLISEG
jgi:hypothetical protein